MNLNTKKQDFTILCVDDEENNIDIIEKHLKKENFHFHSVASADEAKNFLRHSKEEVAVIVLDKMMPGTDGIDFLTELKKDVKFFNIPVILQTSATSNEDVKKGLEAGAYYYLQKPYKPDILITTVSSAFRSYLQTKADKAYTKDFITSLPHIQDLKIRIKITTDISFNSSYLARVAKDQRKVIASLSHLIVNEIEHGNLEIGFEQKSELLCNGTYEKKLQALQKEHEDKCVEITLTRDNANKQVIYTIKDQGKGFNPSKVMKFEPHRMHEPNGRGIAMVNLMMPTALLYDAVGNIASLRVASFS